MEQAKQYNRPINSIFAQTKQQRSAHHIYAKNFNSHVNIEGINSQDNTPISNVTRANEVVSPFRKAYEGHVQKSMKQSKGRDSKLVSESRHSNNNLEQFSSEYYQSMEYQPQKSYKPHKQQEQQNIKQDITLAKRFKFQLDIDNKKSKIGLIIGRDSLLNQDVAIKLFGGKKPKLSKSQMQFFNQEREILLKLRNQDGFSKIIESGYEEECDLYYIVMQKFEVDLNTIVKKAECGRLSLQTVINFGIEMITRLETLHQLGIVHRDLKPKNIMLNKKEDQIFLIDFGLSNKFMSQYQTHIQYRSTKKILGTPLYASNNALLGKEISRRDDIESLVYIMIFALQGYLPWKGQLKLDFLKSPSAKNKIHEWRNPYGELCQELEPEFREMLDYAQKLEFEEEPDYEYLESLLQVIKERYDFDDSFDWDNKHQEKPKSQTKIVIQNEDDINNDQPAKQQDKNFLNLNMVNEFRTSIRKSIKYKSVKKLKKGASNIFTKADQQDLLNITKQSSHNAQSDNQNSEQNHKQNLLKVRKNNHSKRRLKLSNKQIFQSPAISDIMQTPNITQCANSNNASNNVSNHGCDISNDNPKSQDNMQRSDSIHLNFHNVHKDLQDLSEEIISQDEEVPSDEQNHHKELNIYDQNLCSGTAGIDFNLSKYWDQDSLDEGFNIIKNVPEFNNKRTIIQRNSEILMNQNVNKSPIRINKLNSLNSCTEVNSVVENLNINIVNNFHQN